MTRHVLITRHPGECRELQELLRPHDIILRPYPVLRFEEADDQAGWRAVLQRLPPPSAADSGAWLVLASPRAPQRFAAQAAQRQAGHLLALPAAAVGQTTAAAAADTGLQVRLTGFGGGTALAEQLIPLLAAGAPVVLACGHDRRPELPRALTAAGVQVLPVVVYRMVPTPPREMPPLGPRADAVVLTSPRAARYYLEAVGGLPLPCPHVALGPTTRTAAEGLGIACHAAERPTMKSLAEELLCQI